ncbi:hypothetical protein [Novosphingobium sp. JCM 18896]|uniref:hypothetical protein n=1 Tax=Novosphingobium sp. JCM 18896 TaxID=2989731 RepID=UPI0029C9C8BD|nr:hypothetical protein [Novosphingobium sp. JCM 18896]
MLLVPNAESKPMSILNSIFGQFGQHVDVANMAEKLGIQPALAEKAIAALGQSHAEPGDTIAGAAAKTGLDSGVLGQIVEQIGGEGSLGEFARTLKDHPQASGLFAMLDRDGDGNPLNDVTDLAKGLFGKG